MIGNLARSGSIPSHAPGRAVGAAHLEPAADRDHLKEAAQPVDLRHKTSKKVKRRSAALSALRRVCTAGRTTPFRRRSRPPTPPSRANANDRLARPPLGRVEGGDSLFQRRDHANVRPQPTVPHPLDDLGQLGPIGFNDEIDSQAFFRS